MIENLADPAAYRIRPYIYYGLTSHFCRTTNQESIGLRRKCSKTISDIGKFYGKVLERYRTDRKRRIEMK